MKQPKQTRELLPYLHVSRTAFVGYYEGERNTAGIPSADKAEVTYTSCSPQEFAESIYEGYAHRLAYDSLYKKFAASEVIDYIGMPYSPRPVSYHEWRAKTLWQLRVKDGIAGYILATPKVADLLVCTNWIALQEEDCDKSIDRYFNGLPIELNIIIDRSTPSKTAYTLIYVLDFPITGANYAQVYSRFENTLTLHGSVKRNFNRFYATPTFYIMGVRNSIYHIHDYTYEI